MVCALLASCTASGPTAPDFNETSGIALQGSFVGSTPTQSSFKKFSAANFEGITVEVAEDPRIQTTVGANGIFVLRGLPEGSFTLVFRRDLTLLGEFEFSTVKPNMEIRISVELSPGGTIRLVDERRTGIGHGDLEIEGLVADIVSSGPHDKEGTLVVNGFTVHARPGETSIREGNRDRSIFDIRVETRVHVKAVAEPDGLSVLAMEIKIQGSPIADEPPGEESGACPLDTKGKITICHIPPGNPANRHTISVSPNAWPAHRSHGDTCGPCTGEPGSP